MAKIVIDVQRAFLSRLDNFPAVVPRIDAEDEKGIRM